MQILKNVSQFIKNMENEQKNSRIQAHMYRNTTKNELQLFTSPKLAIIEHYKKLVKISLNF